MNKKWGQGQLFAFSGLDGKTDFKNDLVGTLSADRISIIFHTKVRRELAIVGHGAKNITFSAVTGDYINVTFDETHNACFVFYKNGVVVGSFPENSFLTVFCEGEILSEDTENGVTVHNTGDGQVTALAKRDGRFCFALSTDRATAVEKAVSGLSMDLNNLCAEKEAYYNGKTISDKRFKGLYSKCVSIMKTQIYSPDGRFKQHWSTPDRLPHRFLWLWDSVFHAIGHRNINTELAEELILSVLDTQRDDGMIPHMSSPGWSSDITQPPVLAWGALKVFERTSNKQFLNRVFVANTKFLSWCDKNRKPGGAELYSWNTADKVDCRCDESGMDNSPRFDEQNLLQTIDFSCFMANEMQCMAKICDILGVNKEHFVERFNAIKNDINNYLWDEEEGFYYDRNVADGKLHKVGSVASFLPLFSGVATLERAKVIIKQLFDPEKFGRPCLIPCLEYNQPTFGTDMWRGPVWINYNYMIAEGLDNYGEYGLSEKLRIDTVNMVNRWYKQSGTVFEFYDSQDVTPPWLLNRKGEVVEPYDFKVRYQAIRDYGWTATLTLDMLCRLKNNNII